MEKKKSKKRSYVILLLCFISLFKLSMGRCESDDEISKTYFSAHMPFKSVSPERDSYFRNSFIKRSEDLMNKFDLTIFGGVSRNTDRLARYFLPNGKCSIRIANDKAPNAALRDVNAVHLNIDHEDHAFESIVSFNPKETIFGFGILYRQWFSRSSDKNIWYEISFPILHVEHDLGLKENIISSGNIVIPTRVANASWAFSQETWKFGKIYPKKKISTVGVSDIELKFGWEAFHSDCCHAETFLGFVLPTGTRPNGFYLYEPILGNNHHWGFITGSTLAIRAWERDDHEITCILGFNRDYLFAAKEMRSFDLIGKPWGRYLEVYADEASAQKAYKNQGDVTAGDRGDPGINTFTRCVNVTPGYIVTFNTGYLYSYHELQIEIGYNFFTRPKEKIDCIGWLKEELSGPALVGAQGGGKTSRARTISQNFEASDQPIRSYQALSIRDLDINSAAHPAVHSHTFYSQVGYQWTQQEYPLLLNAGLSYEFGSNNAALSRLLGWGKVELMF